MQTDWNLWQVWRAGASAANVGRLNAAQPNARIAALYLRSPDGPDSDARLRTT